MSGTDQAPFDSADEKRAFEKAREAARREGARLTRRLWNAYVRKFSPVWRDDETDGEDAWATIREDLPSPRKIRVEPPQHWIHASAAFLDRCAPAQKQTLATLGLAAPLSLAELRDFLESVRDGERREGDVRRMRLPLVDGSLPNLTIWRGYEMRPYETALADLADLRDWLYQAETPLTPAYACALAQGRDFWQEADEAIARILEEEPDLQARSNELDKLVAAETQRAEDVYKQWRREDASRGQRLSRLKDLSDYLCSLCGCEEHEALAFLVCDKRFTLPWITVEIQGSGVRKDTPPPPWSHLTHVGPPSTGHTLQITAHSETVPAAAIRSAYLDASKKAIRGEFGSSYARIAGEQVFVPFASILESDSAQASSRKGLPRGRRASSYRLLEFVRAERARGKGWDAIFLEWQRSGQAPQYGEMHNMQSSFYRLQKLEEGQRPTRAGSEETS